jgi:hypothetical protein
MLKILAMFVCIFAFGTAFANTKTKAIELEVAKSIRTPAFVERVLDGYALTGMPRQILKEHIQELYKSNEVVEMLVKEMLNAGAEKWDKDKQSEYGKRFVAELFLSYAMKGMPRLTFEEQKTYVKFILNWLYVASDDDCKKLLISGGTTSSLVDANIEMKYYHRMEREELRNYFATIRKSVLAELRGYPSAKNINQQQSKIADDAFENELKKRVDAGLIDDKTLFAMADMTTASPKLACNAGKQILNTMLGMKGFGGELFLTKFVNSLQ